MPDIREEFEAAGLTAHLERDPEYSDRYDYPWTQAAWIGWQASRAALKVELPRPLHYGEGAIPYVDGWNTSLHFTTEKLSEQGIEVIPCTSP